VVVAESEGVAKEVTVVDDVWRLVIVLDGVTEGVGELVDVAGIEPPGAGEAVVLDEGPIHMARPQKMGEPSW
jgi:hypothetical protein